MLLAQPLSRLRCQLIVVVYFVMIILLISFANATQNLEAPNFCYMLAAIFIFLCPSIGTSADNNHPKYLELMIGKYIDTAGTIFVGSLSYPDYAWSWSIHVS